MIHTGVSKTYKFLTDNPHREPRPSRYLWVEYEQASAYCLPASGPAEEQQLIVEWSPTPMPFWRSAPLPQAFRLVANEIAATFATRLT